MQYLYLRRKGSVVVDFLLMALDLRMTLGSF